ncbi:flagellar biosynthesis protein [Clostridium swellfunianum]|uniref:TIGR02530 family flagellar biosynthesis protein n=1 Tax=Clostridium swellfunianum TaxID=1367462 RepID=UPI0020309D0E|nr:TIGR02530 family flagellar biosynthesis protein [Clostridium swellfunianum]MCM0650444.1 flagellar biosynthesis protein [Clostridium swellfunianum]
MGYRVINGTLYQVNGIQPVDINSSSKPANKSKESFSEILKNTVDKRDSFLISNHAAERLKDRNISLNESDMNRINEGINKADEKGAKESLILYKDVVFVASIKNRTIITAVDKEGSKDNVFTNIDSVVLL